MNVDQVLQELHDFAGLLERLLGVSTQVGQTPEQGLAHLTVTAPDGQQATLTVPHAHDPEAQATPPAAGEAPAPPAPGAPQAAPDATPTERAWVEGHGAA